jgi:sugar (pentulose or hexulose) kinase
VFAYSDKPVVDPEGAIAAFCDSTGAWLPLLCTMNVTGVTEQVRTLLGDPSHESITKAAAAVAAGSDGLLFLPYLQGERVPNLPGATGALLGMRHDNLTPGHLFRAAIEGATLGLVSGIERMKRLGLSVSSVRVVGGGSKNPLWRQIIADALQVRVETLVEPESAALGGAIQAFWVARVEAGESISADDAARALVQVEGAAVAPQTENAAAYRDALGRFEGETVRLFQ